MKKYEDIPDLQIIYKAKDKYKTILGHPRD